MQSNVRHALLKALKGRASRRLQAASFSSFIQLPTELIIIIFQHLPLSDRYSLICTCRRLADIGEPVLYVSLVVMGYRRERRLRLFETLAAQPELAASVKEFKGFLGFADIRSFPRPRVNWFQRLLKPHSKSKNPGDENAAYARVVANAFSLATNIRSLNIVDLERGDWESRRGTYPDIKSALAKMCLERLVLQSRGGPVDVVHFVRSQPDLAVLELRWGAWNASRVEPADVPNLETLHCDLNVASYLVPGRPIKNLRLNLLFAGVGPQEAHRLSLSTGPIRCLTLSIFYWLHDEAFTTSLHNLISHLPALETLYLEGPGDIDIRSAAREIARSSSLHHLHVRRLAHITAELSDSGHSGPAAGNTLGQLWHELCPQLKAVTVDWTEQDYLMS